jgi:sec-independent protein translocase protein TatA
MFGLNMGEMIIAGVLAIVLFGGRLPEVAKTFGKYYARLRRSLTDLQSQVNLHEIYDPQPARSRSYDEKPRKTYSDFDDRDEPTAPRFEPPPAPAPSNPSSSDAA